MRNCRRLLAALRCQQGISLIEVLVGAAITGLIATVVAGLLMATTTSGRSLARQTDDYESLRLPATMFMEDGRFAIWVSCDIEHVMFRMPGPDTFVTYKFAAREGDEEIPDPFHLHRWLVQDGVVVRDDIVGWNLVQFDAWTGADGTWFACHATPTSRRAEMHLVTSPLPGQEVGAHLEVTAFLR